MSTFICLLAVCTSFPMKICSHPLSISSPELFIFSYRFIRVLCRLTELADISGMLEINFPSLILLFDLNVSILFLMAARNSVVLRKAFYIPSYFKMSVFSPST